MIEVGLFDHLFEGFNNVARGTIDVVPSNIKFSRNTHKEITVFTDDDLELVSQSTAKINVAWLVESPDYKQRAYQSITKKKLYQRFDRIYTFDKELLKKDARFVFLPFGGCWIEDQDWKVYPKTKNVSVIASFKKELEGQRLRHQVIQKMADQLDGVFGSGYQKFDYKCDILKDFRYSIVIENCRRDYYFTEKLLDCFAVGTVPIYWGCPGINRFFNTDGIISFKNMRQLRKILQSINEEDYYSRILAVEDNLHRISSYVMPEDRLAKMMNEDPIFQDYLRSNGG